MRKQLFNASIFMLLASSISPIANAQTFFTQTGAGVQDGSSWDNAFPASQFTTFATTPGNKKIYLASGNYSMTSNISVMRSFYLKGGYPANPVGTDTSAYDPIVNSTVITPVGTSRFEGLGGGTSSNPYIITLQGLELTGFSHILGSVFSFSTSMGSTGYTSVTFKQLYVHDNHSSSGEGGVIYFTSITGPGNSIHVDQSYFENNSCGTDHGGVITFSTVYRDVPGSTVGVNGGINNPFVIENSSFVGNSAPLWGGSIYLTTGADVTITNNGFCTNSAQNGGAIGLTTTNRIEISNNTFSSNTASYVLPSVAGQAIYSEALNGPGNLVSNNVFYNNGTLAQQDLYLSVSGAAPTLFLLTNNTFDGSSTSSFNSNFTATANTFDDPTVIPGCPSLSDALPLKFGSMNAENVNNNALITWTTLNEANNKGFEVEKSTDSRNWTNLGFVSSKADNGNSTTKLNYSFTDTKPAQGVNYYRLKQIDFNGAIEYSPVKFVTFGQLKAIRIYPNPTQQTLTIEGVSKGQSLIVYNTIGQAVLRHEVSTDGISNIDLSTLSSALYQLVVLDKNGVVSTIKFVKQ